MDNVLTVNSEITAHDIQNILLPRFDTHGDHVLLYGFLNALIGEFPGNSGDIQFTPSLPWRLTAPLRRLVDLLRR